MEEDTVELIDYLRVIWRRKILIIVGTLVCIVAGVVMSLRLPVTYRADAVIKIGKKIELQLPSTSISFSLVYLDDPANLATSIPIKYDQNIKGGSGFGLDAGVISGTSMIRITSKGPDSRTEKVLKEIVNRVIDEHLRMTESSVLFYKTLIEKREENVSEIQKELDQEALALREINKNFDKVMGVDLDKEIGVDIGETDPLTLMIIRNNLRQSSITIRSIQDDIFLCQLTIDTLKKNKTRLVSEVKNVAIKPKKKRNIILAGVVGLMMSLFLALFIAYLGNVRGRGEGEGG